MADITHEISDDCAVFTGLSERGKAWIIAQHGESKVVFALKSDVERAQAERFIERAKVNGLVIREAQS